MNVQEDGLESTILIVLAVKFVTNNLFQLSENDKQSFAGTENQGIVAWILKVDTFIHFTDPLHASAT